VDALRRTRSYQPVLTDVRSIAPTGWYGSPQHATVEKAQEMLNAVADSIAKQSMEIFKQLDRIQGGVAEIRQVDKVR
jgi:creatinine amidohydrolase